MENTLFVKVDMFDYCEAFGIRHAPVRIFCDNHDWETMKITPYQLKDFLDKCIDMKLINKEKLNDAY